MKFGIREIIMLGIIVAMLALSYVYFVRVEQPRQAALRADIASKQKALADLNTATSGIDDLASRIKKLQKAIDFFESKLPQEKEMDKILKEVSQMADTSNLQTRTIKTGRSERFAHYSEQPIQMSLSGDFTGFYEFLLQLEKLPRITRMTQMNLQKIQERDGEMQAQLTLSIFFEPDSHSAEGRE